MGFEQLSERLRKKAEKEINAIDADYRSQVDEILQAIESDADRDAKQFLSKAERDAELAMMKTVSQASRNAKAQMAKRRSDMVDQVLALVKARIEDLNDARKRIMLNGLCADAKEIGEDAVILVDEKYISLVERADARVAPLGDFGIVIESADGQVRIDNTLTTIIKTKRVRIASKIIQELFGVGNE